MTVFNRTSENIKRLHDGSRRRFLKASSTFGLALVLRQHDARCIRRCKYGINQQPEIFVNELRESFKSLA